VDRRQRLESRKLVLVDEVLVALRLNAGFAPSLRSIFGANSVRFEQRSGVTEDRYPDPRIRFLYSEPLRSAQHHEYGVLYAISRKEPLVTTKNNAPVFINSAGFVGVLSA
jgi:hypothetical protein